MKMDEKAIKKYRKTVPMPYAFEVLEEGFWYPDFIAAYLVGLRDIKEEDIDSILNSLFEPAPNDVVPKKDLYPELSSYYYKEMHKLQDIHEEEGIDVTKDMILVAQDYMKKVQEQEAEQRKKEIDDINDKIEEIKQIVQDKHQGDLLQALEEKKNKEESIDRANIVNEDYSQIGILHPQDIKYLNADLREDIRNKFTVLNAMKAVGTEEWKSLSLKERAEEMRGRIR